MPPKINNPLLNLNQLDPFLTEFSKKWEMGDGLPSDGQFYDEVSMSLKDRLKHFTYRLSSGEDQFQKIKSEYIKPISSDEVTSSGNYSDEEWKELQKESGRKRREFTESRLRRSAESNNINALLKNAPDKYLPELFDIILADNVRNFPESLIKEGTSDAIDRYPAKISNILGSTMRLYPQDVFDEYVKPFSDEIGGSAFANQTIGEIFAAPNAFRYTKRDATELQNKAKKNYTLLHEKGHLTGENIPSKIEPYGHQASKEEQRSDYNFLESLLSSGLINPTYDSMRGALHPASSDWVKRNSPINIGGGYNESVINPYKFYSEYKQEPKNVGDVRFSQRLTGENPSEKGLSGFYDELQELSKITKEDRAKIFDETGAPDGMEDYFFSNSVRAKADQDHYTNVIQALYNIYNQVD